MQRPIRKDRIQQSQSNATSCGSVVVTEALQASGEAGIRGTFLGFEIVAGMGEAASEAMPANLRGGVRRARGECPKTREKTGTNQLLAVQTL